MPDPELRTVHLEWGKTALSFIRSVATMTMPDGRKIEEAAIIGPRSEGKSWTCLGAILAHAKEHEAAGFPFPVPWLWFRDSFPNHEANLVKDVQRLEWQGIWRISDGGRIVSAEMNGARQVEARLFGLEDISAVERMRGQAVGVYGEEPGPVIGASVSTGWTEAAWETALSSIGDKVPSHCYPALVAMNPSQRSHWSWRRFVLSPAPTVGTWRIPSGERTSERYRARLKTIFRSDANLYTRLVTGEAAVAALGQSAVKGYLSQVHWSNLRQPPFAPGPLYMGWDAWHHPACVIATVSSMGQLRIHFAKRKDGVDIGILIDEAVRPWLTSKGFLTEDGRINRGILHTGDPTMEDGDQSNKDESARKALLKRLPGTWHPSTNAFATLQRSVNTLLRQRMSTGEPTVILGPDADELDEAWSGGWFVDEMGKPVQRGEQGQHSHVGMAAAYLVHSIFGSGMKERDYAVWARQSALTQPWDGAAPDERSPSPAEPALARLEGGPGSAAFRERWGRQYRSEE